MSINENVVWGPEGGTRVVQRGDDFYPQVQRLMAGSGEKSEAFSMYGSPQPQRIWQDAGSKRESVALARAFLASVAAEL